MDSKHLQLALGQVIRKRRKDLGFSQEAFADHVGVHRTYQGSIERGEQNVALKNLLAIANALNTRLSNLFEEAERNLDFN